MQQRSPLDFDLQRIYHKLVEANRGGWCYEMNGLLAWVLAEIGFTVSRHVGGVMRRTLGDAQFGNHLFLSVTLEDSDYLVDVGLGDGIREPVPIIEGRFLQHGLEYRLEKLADGYWRFHNQPHSAVDSFDFSTALADERLLEQTCARLQSDPESPFRRVLVVQKFAADGIHSLLGKIYSHTRAGGKHSSTLPDARSAQELIDQTFGLDRDIVSLWPQIEAAHAAVFERP